MTLKGKNLTRVSAFKYLGVMLSEKTTIQDYVDRLNENLLQQFNSIFSKFYYADKSVLYFLFKTQVMAFYGLELWYDSMHLPRHFRRASINYHKAVKPISGYNVWNSNHDAYESVGVPIFRHLVARRVLNYYISMCLIERPCTAMLRYFLRFRSKLSRSVMKSFSSAYSTNAVWDNDTDAF